MQYVSRSLLWAPTVDMHIVYPRVTRIEADIDVLFRKVVRDSIRGISELQLGSCKRVMANRYHYPSERGHSVCMAYPTVLLGRADSPTTVV